MDVGKDVQSKLQSSPEDALADDAVVEEPAQVLSPVQIQQKYFENLPDCDWVKYEKNNRNHLLQNVAFALFGSPSFEGELSAFENKIDARLEGYTSRHKEQVMKVYEKLCQQSKYSLNDEDIVMSVLLIVCAKPKPVKLFQIKPSNYWLDLHHRTDTDIWCTAVFRVRKCIPTTVGAKSCRVYIDENGRVYQDWESYLSTNTLPKCVLVVPTNGEYQGTLIEGENFAVKLTVVPSPSLGLKARVLSSADTASTLASLGAVGVLGAAALTPVGPAFITGALVATVATGVYGLVRSSLHLHDRRTHEQSISPANAEARGSWLNIAASGGGLAAGAASSLLARSAAAGANMTKYRKHGEKPSKLELFQFAAATLFFCSAAVSTRTAQAIVEDAQAQTINEYRTTLRSNRHRKMFDKLSAEARRTQGPVQGNTEIIQGIKNIVDKDQYFQHVLRINKEINQHKLRISMTADGQVNLNSQHKFNPSDLYNIGKQERSQLFTNLGPSSGGPRNVSTGILPSTTTVGKYLVAEDDMYRDACMLQGIRPGEIIHIGTLMLRISASGAENIAQMLENLSEDIYVNLMTVSFNVLYYLLPQELANLKLLNPDNDLVSEIVKFVFNYMKHKRPLGDISRDSDNGIAVILKDFFQYGKVRRDTILHLKDRMVAWIDGELTRRLQQFPNKKTIVCQSCEGIRFQSLFKRF